MFNLSEVQRPSSIEEALRLLQQPYSAALAGGTTLVARKRRDIRILVDLSGLGLSYIRESSGAIALGATTTLSELVQSPILRAAANGILAQAAQRSATSVLRNQGTLAGTLLSEPNGVLAAALLALDSNVAIMGKELRVVPFLAFHSQWQQLLKGAFITELTIPLANPRASLQSVGRTPRDKPIVCACVAARIEQGIARNIRVSLAGVDETAIRALEVEKALEGQELTKALIEEVSPSAAQGLAPRGDFRGSAKYRREMAVVLTRRALFEFST